MIDEYLTIFLTFPVWFFSVRLNNTVLEALGGALVQAEKLKYITFLWEALIIISNMLLLIILLAGNSTYRETVRFLGKDSIIISFK